MKNRYHLLTLFFLLFLSLQMKRKNDKRNENRRQARAIKKRKAIAQLHLAVRERDRVNRQQRRTNAARKKAIEA